METNNTLKKKNRYLNIFRILAIVTILTIPSMLTAQSSKFVSSEGSYDFGGFDLVSYFTDDEPSQGVKEFNFEYVGLNLVFANKENLRSFKENPDKYLPAYGGYCATAVSSGSYITPNFSQFTIQGDRLMFFEVKAFFNGKTQWEKDPDLYEILANKNYNHKFAE